MCAAVNIFIVTANALVFRVTSASQDEQTAETLKLFTQNNVITNDIPMIEFPYGSIIKRKGLYISNLKTVSAFYEK